MIVNLPEIRYLQMVADFVPAWGIYQQPPSSGERMADQAGSSQRGRRVLRWLRIQLSNIAGGARLVRPSADAPPIVSITMLSELLPFLYELAFKAARSRLGISGADSDIETILTIFNYFELDKFQG